MRRHRKEKDRRVASAAVWMRSSRSQLHLGTETEVRRDVVWCGERTRDGVRRRTPATRTQSIKRVSKSRWLRQLARSGLVSASLIVTREITFNAASISARSPGVSEPSRLASATQALMSFTSVVARETNSAAVIRVTDASCAPPITAEPFPVVRGVRRQGDRGGPAKPDTTCYAEIERAVAPVTRYPDRRMRR